jgi:hypothetical protein
MAKPDEKFTKLLNTMATIIDKVGILPSDCPAVKNSELYKSIEKDIENLITYMNNQVIEMNKETDETNARTALSSLSNNKKNYNN